MYCLQGKKEKALQPLQTFGNRLKYYFLQYSSSYFLYVGAELPVPPSSRGRVCHCSRVTTSTACPSSVTVLSMRVVMGAMAT